MALPADYTPPSDMTTHSSVGDSRRLVRDARNGELHATGNGRLKIRINPRKYNQWFVCPPDASSGLADRRPQGRAEEQRGRGGEAEG